MLPPEQHATVSPTMRALGRPTGVRVIAASETLVRALPRNGRDTGASRREAAAAVQNHVVCDTNKMVEVRNEMSQTPY